MKKTIILKLLYIPTFILLISGCSEKKQTFTISGEIYGAKGKTLYLEHIGVSKNSILDSVELTSGSYKFHHERPAFPDFYRLRLGNQMVNIAIDSTETIHISGEANTLATEYMLDEKDIKNKRIKELTLLQIKTKKEYNNLINQFDNGGLQAEEFKDQVYSVINQYKDKAKEYISDDFQSLVAYYALFQQINDLLIFNPYDKEDSKIIGAIANSWNINYPKSVRASQLKNLYANSKSSFKEVSPLIINEANTKTLFDISLPDVDNKDIRLSEVSNGKVTIIDFTAYSMEGSPVHNMLLAELYKKYQSKGFEIYQVSLDSDNHIWKNAAINLSWICVRDPDALYSSVATKYNVTNIPSTFIMNRKGEIVYRVENYIELEKEILKLL